MRTAAWPLSNSLGGCDALELTPHHFATLSHGREAGREGQDKRTVDVERGPHAQDGASAADDELALWAPLLPRLAPDPHREPPWYVPFESACPRSLSERSATSALTCFPAPSDPAYEHQVRTRYSIPVLRGLRPNSTLSIPFAGHWSQRKGMHGHQTC